MKKISQKKAYRDGIEFQFEEPVKLGPIVSYSIRHDPIHMSFVLSRYKFVARMLTGKQNVLEIGCADGFGTPIVAQFVKKLTAIDIDARLIDSDIERLSFLKNVTFQTMEFGNKQPGGLFDAIYAIDVIEHLDPAKTQKFMQSVCNSLTPQGVALFGTPNIRAGEFASKQSSMQHINTGLQNHESLKKNLLRYFDNVFLFGMNDELVHTGFLPMAHYLWALCTGAKYHK